MPLGGAWQICACVDKCNEKGIFAVDLTTQRKHVSIVMHHSECVSKSRARKLPRLCVAAAHEMHAATLVCILKVAH